MNIDISNANCGRGHSPDHACLRVGFLAIAALRRGALGCRRRCGTSPSPPSPQVQTRWRVPIARRDGPASSEVVAVRVSSLSPLRRRTVARTWCALDGAPPLPVALASQVMTGDERMTHLPGLVQSTWVATALLSRRWQESICPPCASRGLGKTNLSQIFLST